MIDINNIARIHKSSTKGIPSLFFSNCSQLTLQTESARSALSSFTCTLCNKSYSRHPEYESHISSYDHQHRKRLQDLKQLSRDPNAAEKARRSERKADAEAGLRVIDNTTASGGTTSSTGNSGGKGGGFKKGGFKSSFASVKGGPVKKNVLGDEDEGDIEKKEKEKDIGKERQGNYGQQGYQGGGGLDIESETDEEDYYDPRKPSGCSVGCGVKV